VTVGVLVNTMTVGCDEVSVNDSDAELAIERPVGDVSKNVDGVEDFSIGFSVANLVFRIANNTVSLFS